MNRYTIADSLSDEQLIAMVEVAQKETPKAMDVIEHMMIRISRLEKRVRELEAKDEA